VHNPAFEIRFALEPGIMDREFNAAIDEVDGR
jgi:hypothetical protein